jgi:type 1 fimbriae regulatory protein FimE
VFLSERGAPFSVDTIQAMLKRLAKRAGVADLKPHPHMLRHACGHKLASEGQDTRAIQHYLGHVNIQHTVKYTELAPNRFRKFKW